MIVPIRQATKASRVSTCESTMPSPIVFATTTPKRKGPKNAATAVSPNATSGRKARDEIMVATILLESRIPLKNSKINARVITRVNSGDIDTLLSLLHYNIRDDIRRFVSAICGIREMTIHFAHFQHFHNMMNILRPAEQVCDRFAIHRFHAVLQCLGALRMVDRDIGVFGQAHHG